ncbi:MAG: hypothetical protein BGO01_14635 [Armatimonadetes bacterium 55-13]|nr:MAG: hypothetical protein BGO01_14635 [Armatimonadetes bacterium 55-13]
MSTFLEIFRPLHRVDSRAMRFLSIMALTALLVAGMEARAQGVDLFKTVRPQVILSVKRDPNGSQADLIEAQTIDGNYPPEQLKAQILELGRQLNCDPRGLTVFRHSVSEDGSMTSIKATCAIDNVIDRRTGSFHLTEIVRAFTGFPEPHRVSGLSLSFLNEAPRKNTILTFGQESGPVMLQADLNPTFKSIDYRIKINTDKPDEISIPEGPEQNKPINTSSDDRNSVDWSLWGLIGVAAIAVGALVYSLLIRTTSSKRS